MILLGAAAVLIMPSFSGALSSLRLETASRDLITHMRQARAQAVGKQKVFRIILRKPESPDKPFVYVLADEYAQVVREFNLPEGIAFAHGDQLPTTISFYPNGRSSGGSTLMENPNGKKVLITVSPVTGFGKVKKEREAIDTW